MKLVVDTNILFSFFRDNPVRNLIINSKLYNLELFCPNYALEELRKNIPDLIKYTKSNLQNIELIIEQLKKNITSIPSLEYKKQEADAKKLSPHGKDIPIFALALKLNCAIWSNEHAFKNQSLIKTFDTKELRLYLNAL